MVDKIFLCQCSIQEQSIVQFTEQVPGPAVSVGLTVSSAVLFVKLDHLKVSYLNS